MKVLKDFMLNFCELQQTNGNYIEFKTAYAAMKLQTENALNNHLKLVCCIGMKKHVNYR